MRERNLVNMCSMFDAADADVEEKAEKGTTVEEMVNE